MFKLSEEVAKGNNFLGKIIVVGTRISEIDLGDFTPIGTNLKPFSGTFDGSGINFKLNITKSDLDYVGLFGFVNNGVIENFSLSGDVIGSNYVGSVTGYQTNSQIRNIYTIANVTGYGNYVGGLVGSSNYKSIVNYTYSNSKVTGNTYVGGITGSIVAAYQNNSTIRNNYSRSEVSGKSYLGGVSGFISDSYLTDTNNYYDTRVIETFKAKDGFLKPSTLETTKHAINSDIFISEMTNKLDDKYWHFEEISGNIGYYPRLKYFDGNHLSNSIKNRNKKLTEFDLTDGTGTLKRPF